MDVYTDGRMVDGQTDGWMDRRKRLTPADCRISYRFTPPKNCGSSLPASSKK